MKALTQQTCKGTTIHVILLISSIGVILGFNAYFKDQTALAVNIIYIPVMIVFVITSIYFALEFRKKIKTIAPLCLVASAVSWLVAEIVWTVEEMILHIEPFPSAADIFYILGYPFLFMFLYEISKSIQTSHHIKIISASVGMAFFIPTIVASFTWYRDDPFQFALAATYTIFDALLIWIALNNILTINNKENLFWLLIFAGMSLMLIADSFFIYLAISDEYYTGHPVDIIFLCSYIAISFALYYQAKMSKRNGASTIDLFGSTVPIKANFLQKLILISSSVIVIIATSMALLLDFNEFTTNETTAFSIIMATSIVIVVVLSALTYVLNKKLDHLRESEIKYTESAKVESSGIITLQANLERLEKTHKKTGTYTLIGVLAIVTIFAYYVSENFFDVNPSHWTLQSGRYLIENAQGTTLEQDVLWKIKDDEILQVDIVNAKNVPADKIDAIKKAILSEKTVDIANSELGKEPADLVSTYHLGWMGALEKAGETEQSVFSIPTDFQIIESDKTLGDISIILSNQKQTDGSTSFTQIIADENEHQILKVYITIFDVKNLRSHDFEDIIRHEFAHALGLTHQKDTNLNLHDTHAYITQCNIDDIIKLYNDDFTHVPCMIP